MQLRQLTQNTIHTEPVDITLIKKCKTVDVTVRNVQRALQKYVKFPGMDSEYSDSINELLDTAENWCLRTEKLYNKDKIHCINMSKCDTADVGVFPYNANVTIYEF